MRQGAIWEEELAESLKALFRKHQLAGRLEPARQKGDFIFDFVFAADRGFKIYIEAKRRVSSLTIAQCTFVLAQISTPGNYVLLAAPDISQSLIDHCSDPRVLFFSPDGASRIEVPGLVYVVKMMTAKPKRQAGTGGTAFVGKAAMLARIFLSSPGQSRRQIELANMARMSRGYVSIMIKRMLAADYLAEENGAYSLISPDKMLDDWAAVYRFDRYFRKQMFAFSGACDQNGMRELSHRLRQQAVKHAFMGGSGAMLRAPYMEQTVISAYVTKIPEKTDGLYPVPGNGNVALYVPPREDYFFDCRDLDGLPVVSDVQLYLDLRKMPGRHEDQAEYLRDTLLNWSSNAER